MVSLLLFTTKQTTMNTPWLDKEEYPFTSQYMTINGRKLHYIDEGHGNVLLFIHGTPSWSFDYRKCIKILAQSYRCIAIDHIGFGLSDKPEHYDYSTPNHSNTLEQFILEKELTDITLIVQDFGGPIGLNVAIKHPHLIKHIVIFNSWLWSSADEPHFKKFSKILRNPLLPFLYRYLNFSPRFVLPTMYGDKKPTKHILKHYTQPFSNKRERNGTIAFAQSLLNDQEWFQDLWNKKQSIANKPTLFIWGMKDPVIIPHYLDIFERGFSHSTTVRLETCGHFPQEEEPNIVADAIDDFLLRHP